MVDAARVAFADAPDDFPAHLAIPVKAKPDGDDAEAEPNRALAALEDAAKATANWISGAANAAGAGVATAAGAVARPFRSVDLDGDGIPDAPQALTAAKGVGGAIAGAAGAVGGAAASLFKNGSGDAMPLMPTDQIEEAVADADDSRRRRGCMTWQKVSERR